ncbi:fluoride efflux transporter CrcB [Candidatus Woesearchaeota archaeon]|nr:fluoride efflux transporter CrcB [Candidatus Woesearchaeota archaeon]|tara:strand:- start:212 stop:583 length:372 start_codon:yes stop_codon:yes gene_type:complete
MLSHWLLVALGGAIGAVLRFYVSETLPSETFPWATLSVNLVGSFLLGIVMAATVSNVLGEAQAMLLGIGVLGAFTTMSTFSVETVMMMEDGRWRTAGIYVAASAMMGPLLAWLGWKTGHTWLA